jgi:hypothetical protein
MEKLKRKRGRAEFGIDKGGWKETEEILYFFSSMFP